MNWNHYQNSSINRWASKTLPILLFLLFPLLGNGQVPTLINEPTTVCGFEKVFETSPYPISGILINIEEVRDSLLLTYQRSALSGTTVDRIAIDNQGNSLSSTSMESPLPLRFRASILSDEYVVSPTTTDSSIILTKSDLQGQTLWQQTFSPILTNTINNLSLTDIIARDSAYYLTGIYVDVDTTFNPTFLNFVIKTDLEGNLIFNNIYPAENFQTTFFYDLDDEDDVYLGYQTSSRTGHIFKVDANGLLVWDISVIGDLVSNRITSVQLSQDKNAIYVAGFRDPKAFLRKYDVQTGTQIWDIAPGELFSTDGDYTIQERLQGMLLTRDGSIVISYPYKSSNDSSIEGYEYGKIDQDGNAIWSKRLNDRPYQYGLFVPELETQDGSLVFLGPAYKTVNTADSLRFGIFKTNSTGDLLPACTPVVATCSAEIITFNSQAEVDAFGPCERFDGNIAIAGADITNLDALGGLKEITEGLFIRTTASSLTNIDGLSDLEVIGGAFEFIGTIGVDSVSIPLTTLDGLSSLRSVGDKFMISGSNLQSITLPNLETIGDVLQLIPPSNLLELIDFPKLRSIEGNLVISGANRLENLSGFSALTSISDFLVIANNTALTSLSGLENLTNLGQSANGEFLTIINNPNLTDCCSVLHLVQQADSSAISIARNALTCAGFSSLASTCAVPVPYIDLELGISTINPNPAIFTRIPLTVTITNKGVVEATNIGVNLSVCGGQSSGFQRASGIVYATTSFDASMGDYEYLEQNWTIDNLPPGASASLTVYLFTLSEEPINIGASVIQASPQDIDSSPNFLRNIDICEVNEDDEADLILNGIRICDCPETYEPVCGSDGYIYDNPCEAACVGVAWEEGECLPSTGTINCGEITVTYGNGIIEIVGQQDAEYFFKIHRRQPVWEYVFECNSKCGFAQIIDNLPMDTYYIDVYDKSWHLICDDIEVVLDGLSIGGRAFDSQQQIEKMITKNSANSFAPSFESLINIFPNPASSQVQIDLPSTVQGNGFIYITDKFGRFIQQYSLEAGIQTIPLNHFANGVYQLSVVANGQLVAVKKLVIVK